MCRRPLLFGGPDNEGVTLFEVGTMWLSSIVLFGIVMFGGRKWMGWALFGAYVAFIIGEFVLDRR